MRGCWAVLTLVIARVASSHVASDDPAQRPDEPVDVLDLVVEAETHPHHARGVALVAIADRVAHRCTARRDSPRRWAM